MSAIRADYPLYLDQGIAQRIQVHRPQRQANRVGYIRRGGKRLGRGHGDLLMHQLYGYLIRPSILERVYRDLSFYVRHDNDDQILATIGKSILGLTHDPSFYKP